MFSTLSDALSLRSLPRESTPIAPPESASDPAFRSHLPAAAAPAGTPRPAANDSPAAASPSDAAPDATSSASAEDDSVPSEPRSLQATSTNGASKPNHSEDDEEPSESEESTTAEVVAGAAPVTVDLKSEEVAQAVSAAGATQIETRQALGDPAADAQGSSALPVETEHEAGPQPDLATNAAQQEQSDAAQANAAGKPTRNAAGDNSTTPDASRKIAVQPAPVAESTALAATSGQESPAVESKASERTRSSAKRIVPESSSARSNGLPAATAATIDAAPAAVAPNSDAAPASQRRRTERTSTAVEPQSPSFEASFDSTAVREPIDASREVPTAREEPVKSGPRSTASSVREGHSEPSAANLNDLERSRLVQRVAKAVRHIDGEGGWVRIRLSPPELGSLRIEVSVQGGVMAARFEADNPVTRTLLLENLPALRERLAEQQIRVERFDVDLSQRDSGGGAQAWADQHSGAPWQRPAARGTRRASGPARVEDPASVPRQRLVAGRFNVLV